MLVDYTASVHPCLRPLFSLQIWQFSDAKRQWAQQGPALTGHTDWVRDVAWAPNLGMPLNTIASAGQDGKVIIWTEQNNTWSKLVSFSLHLVA